MTHKQYPINGTVFDLDVANHLADLSFRTKKPGPWKGKEEALLDALWWAELGHAKSQMTGGTAQVYRPLLRKLKGTSRKKGLHTKIIDLCRTWNELTDEERRQFAAETQNMGEVRPVDELHDEIERVLRNLFGTSTLIVGVNSPKGEVPKLSGLKRFVDRLQCRWDEKGFVDKFSAEFDIQHDVDNSLVPMNAASKLVWHAARLLGCDYTPQNCDYVMRPRR